MALIEVKIIVDKDKKKLQKIARFYNFIKSQNQRNFKYF